MCRQHGAILQNIDSLSFPLEGNEFMSAFWLALFPKEGSLQNQLKMAARRGGTKRRPTHLRVVVSFVCPASEVCARQDKPLTQHDAKSFYKASEPQKMVQSQEAKARVWSAQEPMHPENHIGSLSRFHRRTLPAASASVRRKTGVGSFRAESKDRR